MSLAPLVLPRLPWPPPRGLVAAAVVWAACQVISCSPVPFHSLWRGGLGTKIPSLSLFLSLLSPLSPFCPQVHWLLWGYLLEFQVSPRFAFHGMSPLAGAGRLPPLPDPSALPPPALGPLSFSPPLWIPTKRGPNAPKQPCAQGLPVHLHLWAASILFLGANALLTVQLVHALY